MAPSSPQAPLEEKALTAEKYVAWVRAAVIGLNVAVYFLLLDPALATPWLANTVIAVAVLYAVYVLAAEPYRRFPVLGRALFTSVTDGVLITAWILATGGFASPFYVLWYVSIVAIAFRFDAPATLATTALYAATYVLMLALRNEVLGHAAEVVVRTGYIVFVGVLGALLAREALAQTRAKHELRQVHEEERRNEERQREIERLRELDRFKTQFMNNVAHEMGTPLTPIKLQLHLLKSRHAAGLSEEGRQSLDMLDRNLQRLAGLVQEMLESARLQAGRFRIHRAPMDLGRVVREVAADFHAPALQAGVLLDAHVEGHLDIDGDHARLTQVLYNLLHNAVKFTPPGGRIEVAAAAAGDRALVHVRDTGRGLTPDQIAKLFHPFSQAQDPTNVPQGSGLGLYICRAIVEGHGGEIRCESAGSRQGTTFEFWIPIHAPPPEAATPFGSAAPVPA